MRESEIGRGGRVLRVRDAGEPDGSVVMYFHGTPGSRLDLCFGEQLAAERGVRLVSFDRPGYGGSAPAQFGLASIAADAHAVADGLGVARFATLGMSGGGPGALAAAAGPGGRVIRAGIASGAGPFQLVPGALDELDDNDRAAVLLLPGDPAAAASAFAAGFEPLAELARVPGGPGVVSAFEDLLSSRDSELLQDQRFASAFAETMREALRPGTSGAGWDNVSWIGPWDIDLSAVRCPVLLWYGSDDRFAPPAHGLWLSQNLPRARLVLRDGEGHLGIYEHLGEMLDALTEPGTPDSASATQPKLRGAAPDIR
jgi:pimeloyl-ACP methyl ester carboxylesterase